MKFTLSHENEWVDHLPAIFKALDGRSILCLEGELGAGKTTFTQSFLHFLQSPELVQSPTFSLINVYQYNRQGQNRNLYHMDLYRLKDLEAVLEIGITEILDSGDMCIIEWPELIYPLLGDDFARMKISRGENNLRIVTFN